MDKKGLPICFTLQKNNTLIMLPLLSNENVRNTF